MQSVIENEQDALRDFYAKNGWLIIIASRPRPSGFVIPHNAIWEYGSVDFESHPWRVIGPASDEERNKFATDFKDWLMPSFPLRQGEIAYKVSALD